MTASIYSPFTGQAWSLDCYCNITAGSCGGCSCGCGSGSGCNSAPGRICAHCPISGYSSPIDISASYGAGIHLYTDCTVGSVATTQISPGCGNGAGSPWSDSVVADLYTGQNKSGTHLGTVVYHHVANRTANGTYNFPTNACSITPYFSLYIGNCASSDFSGCYVGAHVHMQRGGGRVNSLSCNQSVTGGGGGTWIYTF